MDKYQGQQNDYVILSLVRTKHIGHIRYHFSPFSPLLYIISSSDVRRLVVALSRARLGLYILGRLSLFSRCYELREAIQRLTADRPVRLGLLPCEVFEQEGGQETRRLVYPSEIK